ncbi:MAG: chromate transporter [Bacilli bacterium]|nr:chromate transporter [Bacilli bacterium]MBO4682291.1 chromate transporter [Bacilli bacterium]
MNKVKTCLLLMLTFMKIGLFTFGGGYAMIPLIQKEAVEKKGWVTNTEMLEIIGIAESTPGPVAVNTATYVGYKQAGVWGAICATLGLAIPSFVIIYLISLIYETFMSWHVVDAMFKGIKVGVILLLLNAVIKLSKNIDKTKISLIVFLLGLITMTTLSLLQISIPFISIGLILIGALVGVVSVKVKGEKE